jgi:hypothetical protein
MQWIELGFPQRPLKPKTPDKASRKRRPVRADRSLQTLQIALRGGALCHQAPDQRHQYKLRHKIALDYRRRRLSAFSLLGRPAKQCLNPAVAQNRFP